MDYYIFRHAQTYYSKNKVEYGKHAKDAEILPEGIPSIKRLANYLKEIPTDKNYVSSYKRCQETANIVTEITSKKFEVEERLRDYSPAFEETVEEMIERIKSFFESLNAAPYKSVAICSHGFPIGALKQLILGKTVDPQKLDDYPKPGVLLIIKFPRPDGRGIFSPRFVGNEIPRAVRKASGDVRPKRKTLRLDRADAKGFGRRRPRADGSTTLTISSSLSLRAEGLSTSKDALGVSRRGIKEGKVQEIDFTTSPNQE